jgi:Spy/CpxP family protein refolding chaperone
LVVTLAALLAMTMLAPAGSAQTKKAKPASGGTKVEQGMPAGCGMKGAEAKGAAQGKAGCGMKGREAKGMGAGMPGCGMKGAGGMGMAEGKGGCAMGAQTHGGGKCCMAGGPREGCGKGAPGMGGPGMERGMCGPGMGGPGMGLGCGPEMMRELDLSADQQKKVGEICGRYQKLMIQNQADVRIAMIDMRQLAGEEKPDRAKLEAQVDKIAALRVTMAKARLGSLLDMRALLTPEQLKKWHERHMGDNEADEN